VPDDGGRQRLDSLRGQFCSRVLQEHANVSSKHPYARDMIAVSEDLAVWYLVDEADKRQGEASAALAASSAVDA
jgi:hypothetical protein